MGDFISSTFLIRDNQSDTGQGPTSGTACVSPDIIPYNAHNLSTNLIWTTFGADSYNTDFGNTAEPDSPNYIYVRSKNTSNAVHQGKVYLHWSKASLLLAPVLWKHNSLAPGGIRLAWINEAGNTVYDIPPAPMGVCVTETAFAWTPAWVPPTDHYCLIALSTDNDNEPVIPDSFPVIDDFAKWVQGNSGIAWLNLAIDRTGSPTCKWAVKAANPSDNATVFYLILKIEGPAAAMDNGMVMVDVTLPGHQEQMWQVTPGTTTKVFELGSIEANTTFDIVLYAESALGQPLRGISFDTIFTTVADPNHPAAGLAVPPASYGDTDEFRNFFGENSIYHLGDFAMRLG